MSFVVYSLQEETGLELQLYCLLMQHLVCLVSCCSLMYGPSMDGINLC